LKQRAKTVTSDRTYIKKFGVDVLDPVHESTTRRLYFSSH